MAKVKPYLASIGTFWLISFARRANLLRRIVSGFYVPSSPFIPCWDQRRLVLDKMIDSGAKMSFGGFHGTGTDMTYAPARSGHFPYLGLFDNWSLNNVLNHV